MSCAVLDPTFAEEQRRSRLLTDEGAMREVLRTRLLGDDGDVVIERCDIAHIRYRTSDWARARGKPFLSLCYELLVGDRDNTGTGRRHWVHARAYGDAHAARARADAARTEPTSTRFGPPVRYLPDLGAVFWNFPSDPRLPHLSQVVDPSKVRRHLPYEELPRGFRRADAIESVDVDVVRYKAEVRSTARFLLSADAGTHLIYGKTFKHGVADEMARRVTQIRAGLGGHRADFVVPRLLGHSAPARTIWQEALDGRPVLEVLRPCDVTTIGRAAGRGLARFHRLRVTGLPLEAPVDRLAPIGGQVDEMARAFPSLAASLRRLRADVEREGMHMTVGTPSLVHGDFLLKQLVKADGRLGLFDFDDFALGDPVQDLANFIIDEGRNLQYDGLGPDAATALTGAFLRGYRDESASEIPMRRLRWHARVQALRDAYYWHKRMHLMPGFEHELERLLGLAEDPPVGAVARRA